MAEYKSKRVTVQAPPMHIFNRMTDLQSLVAAVPQENRKDIIVEGDTIKASSAGFTIAVAITRKDPFNHITFSDVEAPFHFTIDVYLENGVIPTQTELYITVEAELNFMMKTLLGGKIKEGLDKVVDMIANGGQI